MESMNTKVNTSGAKPGFQVFKILVSILVAAFGAWMIGSMVTNGQFAFAILFTIVIVAGLLVSWLKGLYPHRYIFPGVAGMVIFIIFPLVYTIYIAFTNYSASNLFDLERAEDFHLKRTYRVAGGDYKFDLVKGRSQDQYQIVLSIGGQTLEDGTVAPVKLYASNEMKLYDKDAMAKPNIQSQAEKTEIHVSPIDSIQNESCGIKCKIQFRDYLKVIKVKLDNLELSMTSLHTFSAVNKKFRKIPNKILANGSTITSDYLLLDNENGRLFLPDMEVGYYRYLNDANGDFEGEYVTPGFRVGVGFEQFKKIVTDPNISEPFVKIFIWTVCFAAGTVFITLAIGMVLACLAQWEFLKGRGFYRVFLILPYAVPSFISILVFKGLFNENFGEINRILDFFFGIKPDWFNEAGLARSMLLIVNAWLGYPYMMILCMGLLKSISDDLYEASAMDGAGPFQNFFKITLPLLMKPLTPLLIASFAFNFNNFVLIMLLTKGGPDFIPEAGSTTATMAGATDLLVSYTYRLAFEGGAGGNNYGLASAIATAIFILVGALSVVNLKLSKMAAKD
ncbi:MAG: maltose ABC transporter permease MalF [Succinivibrionaceae bacterium]